MPNKGMMLIVYGLVVRIVELRNEEVAEGAVVALPFEAVEEVSARFTNTLYGYFIGKRLAFSLVENYVKNTWAKFGPTVNSINMMSLFSLPIYTKEGWEKEYEWKPPRCSTYMIFNHDDAKCPKVLKVVDNKVDDNEGFVEAPPKLYYRRVDKGESSKPTEVKTGKKLVEAVVSKPSVNLHNSFCSLAMDDKDEKKSLGEDHVLNVSDSEVDEEITWDDRSGKTIMNCHTKGTSTRVEEVLHVYTQRRLLWRSLCVHKHYVCDKPWCLMGDFNVTLFLEDLSAGVSNMDISMRKFKEYVKEIKVMGVQRTGLRFTWNQKPKGKDGLLKKIDRIMANLAFNDVFVSSHAVFKPYRILDHSPSILNIPIVVKLKPKPFKFYNLISHNESFKEIVKEGWLKQNVSRLRDQLDKVQSALDIDPFNVDLREEEATTVVAFNEATIMEEHFLKQKAKINWLSEGDANTTYFHKAVRSRVSRSRIDVITSADGNVYENEKVANIFMSHYEQFLGQEVKDAIFSMGNEKSPGPDGYTAVFFKEAWDIMADDIVDAVRKLFTNGKLLKELNHTIIALIPKIISNRIKESLKTLVSTNQSAFIRGRSISDNILLTRELMHNYHLDRGPPRCAFKVDIQKAYDTVDWDFLREDKRGLRQGDPLSPYLFTLVMEILTLMLHRRVRDTSLYTYHRCCSILKLINLFFADDLFLFAHGDVGFVSIIKDALEEFKDA
ncbi:hypothetical protein Tco_0565932 [Tanacetum coccineum]